MDLERLVTAAEAADGLDVDRARVRRWAIRYPHAMPVRDRDHRGRKLYRYGDVSNVEWATRVGLRLTV